MVTMVTRKKPKNGIFTRKTIGARDLKLGMSIQFHSGSNMGCVPPGHHLFLSLCKAINAKNGISAKSLEPRELNQ